MRKGGLWVLAALLVTAGGAWGGVGTPQGVSPGDSRVVSVVEARCPTFSWSGVTGSPSYELVVYEVDEAVLEATEALETARSAPLLRIKVPGTAVSWTPSMERCLEPGRRYAWFVRATGDEEAGEWSAAKVFEVASMPSIAEVEEALAVLRRYAGESEAPSREAPPRLERGTPRLPNARSMPPDGRGALEGSKRETLRDAAAPTPGSASLTVDGQVHLGAASSFFKEASLFLWGDGANTALGQRALSSLTTGVKNTAYGVDALELTDTGSFNTASGAYALTDNADGNHNTASGYVALARNISGDRNTASGAFALLSNTTGASSTAFGFQALLLNDVGNDNTAIGVDALNGNTSGSRNVAVGKGAGANATTGDDNIFISHGGMADESATTRIGTQGNQTRTFIAGISGATVTGSTVVVDSNGQLGVATSSRRFKEEIRRMGEASSRLLELRPVTFRYKEEALEGARPVEFGLLAEEVAELYPDLVIYDEDGQPFTVRYQALIPLLLNELQRQHRLLTGQRRELKELRERLAKDLRAKEVLNGKEDLFALFRGIAVDTEWNDARGGCRQGREEQPDSGVARRCSRPGRH